jgi:hypothetical protein
MIRRRALTTGLLLLPVIARGATRPQAVDRFITPILTRLDAIPSGPALLASYPDLAGAPARFATANRHAAYVYDNALAGLALIAAGHPNHAVRLADALVRAQDHDPDYHDGRLRNAYRAGAITSPVALPGWWDARLNQWVEDPYQVGSESGPVAWAILLWTRLIKAGFNAARYQRAANRAAAWITSTLHAPCGFRGGVFGFPPHPQKLGWVSTEQNLDLAVSFAALGLTREAAHARHFVARMHRAKTHLFTAGLTPAGAINPMIAADANLWPVLAGLAGAATAKAAIDRLGWPRANPAGIGFSEASQGIWLEGTGFAALALERIGAHALAAGFSATLAAHQTGGSYVVATSTARLATGLTIGPDRSAEQFDYYRVPALAPTAWAAMAQVGFSPFAD